MDQATKQLIRSTKQILKNNGVIKAGLFGSFARGEATKSSDVDLLIEFCGRRSLLELAGLKIQLEEKLHRKVDLVTYRSIHPRLRKQILHEEVKIL